MDGAAQVEMENERYAADLSAIAEAVAKGVSDKSVMQLASECGILKRDLDVVMNFKRRVYESI